MIGVAAGTFPGVFIMDALIGVEVGSILFYRPLLIELNSSVTSLTLQPEIEL